MRVLGAVLRCFAALILIALVAFALYGAARSFLVAGNFVDSSDPFDVKAAGVFFSTVAMVLCLALAAGFWELLRWLLRSRRYRWERYHLFSAGRAALVPLAVVGLVVALVLVVIGAIVQTTGGGLVWLARAIYDGTQRILFPTRKTLLPPKPPPTVH